MIHSIGNQLSPASLGLPVVTTDRATGTQVEPAVQVTPAEDARAIASRQARQQDAALQSNPQSSLEKALESVNDSLKAWSTGVRFEMDKDAQQLVVSIVDNVSGDVIKTIPSEAMLRIAKMIVQLQGAGVDTQA
ncbi:flagellar protein FlaG [Castellaniella sp.]|uniref:flagellar protein FlaG n=1 Tax=Castellaniella sp. TaxID=1955812 RepID=UPI002AFDFC6F|nr:flagellar protein FlaG [Castellaniella sp.]